MCRLSRDRIAKLTPTEDDTPKKKGKKGSPKPPYSTSGEKNYRFDPTQASPSQEQRDLATILARDLKISSKEVGGEPTTDLSVSDKGGAGPRSPWSPSIPPS